MHYKNSHSPCGHVKSGNQCNYPLNCRKTNLPVRMLERIVVECADLQYLKPALPD